jgi:hypothetical protein
MESVRAFVKFVVRWSSDPAGKMESKWAILDGQQALRNPVSLKLDPARQSAWRHTCKQAGAALGILGRVIPDAPDTRCSFSKCFLHINTSAVK